MASRDPRLDAEADSPNWLAEVIAGLAAREFKRINDPDAHAHDRRDPTWFAGSDTATVTKVPAYDTRTSTDRINALEARILQLERHADGVSKWEFESVKRRLERAEAQLHVMQESHGGAL